MWNTWSRRTKATVFITKKTNSISTKRWKSSSTNICIPRPQLLRARTVQDHDIDHSGDATDKHTRPDSRNVRCPKSRVNAGKILWEQTITRHRHENAGLAKLKDKEN